MHEIDARPSDAIALAVRAGAPIYVARSVFDTAGTTRLEERLKQDEQHVAAELAASARPGENTWVLLFESRTETGPSNVFPVLHFTSADWPGTSYQRELEWEGRKMMAVQLPGANENAAWLIVDPAFWERTAGAVWKFAQRPEPQPPEGEEKKSA